VLLLAAGIDTIGHRLIVAFGTSVQIRIPLRASPAGGPNAKSRVNARQKEMIQGDIYTILCSGLRDKLSAAEHTASFPSTSCQGSLRSAEVDSALHACNFLLINRVDIGKNSVLPRWHLLGNVNFLLQRQDTLLHRAGNVDLGQVVT